MKISLIAQLKEISDLIFHYPKFVFAGNNYKLINEIPVFVYHTIDPIIFESHLKFFKENNYKTLSIHDFKSLIYNKDATVEKSVLLTCDDARLSFWKYAYPLLDKYGMKATLFIIPGRTINNQAKRSCLHDVWADKLTYPELLEIDPKDEELCNWDEINSMYCSNNINIESHTLFHKEVFSSKVLKDFFSVNSIKFKYNSELSPYLSESDIGRAIDERDYYGYPIFETTPIALGEDFYEVSDALKNYCKEYYVSNSRKKSSWKQDLKSKIKNDSSLLSDNLQLVNGYEALKKDLRLAKKIIQKHLGENAGNSICLPWTIGNQTTIKVLRELGIGLCFWGVRKDKKYNKPGDNPYMIVRIKNDFVMRLPGKGRMSLINIYLLKIKRRLANEHVY